MTLLPWFASPEAAMALWMAASVSVPDAATPADKMEAYIKDLPQARRSLLVENYVWAGLMFPGFLKYRTLPQIYVSCPKEGCAPAAIYNLEIIHSYAPATLGRRAGAADMSGIEIYVAPEPNEFNRRDRNTDARLQLDAHITAKTILNFDPVAFGNVPAPSAGQAHRPMAGC
ncbi:hypothetical protein G5V57_03625 [Nordella sp. HKS 07]|uniref:hypothetical protein n=1 Tax=Nordella sp. HKS 07 TaxID=2712222 RepID=UPI0013E1DBC7|nr:hypothetical protein [Nordella sp. HKS 07]QIG46914.1 hypothetical protein G5V57_03625 [Nordella sp. HKS 07]